jgi:hypothetical protein
MGLNIRRGLEQRGYPDLTSVGLGLNIWTWPPWAYIEVIQAWRLWACVKKYPDLASVGLERGYLDLASVGLY